MNVNNSDRSRDSDDSHELSESPSPTTSSRSFGQANSTDVHRGRLDDGNTYPLDVFNPQSPRQREPYVSPNQYVGDTYGSQCVRHPLPMSPTFCEPTGDSLVQRSSHWQSSQNYAVSPGAQISGSPPLAPWDRDIQALQVARGNSTPIVSSPIGFTNHEGWPSPPVRPSVPPLASIPARPLDISTLPAVQGQDDIRTSTGTSPWEWNSVSTVHSQLQLSPSHRSAQRIVSQSDAVSRYDIQRR